MSTTVGVIGAGYWGKNLVRNFADLGALRVVCDTNELLKADFAKRYPDVRLVSHAAEILEDESVPAVAIATPAATHGALVRSALEAGKDVYVEKPLCLSLAEGRELVAMAERQGRILMVGHLLWYHPAVIKLKELISQGELGRLQYLYSNRLNLGKIRREENILWSFAPHDISVILGLLGETPESVTAKGGNYLHEKNSDVTVSFLTFPSGVQAHVFVSWLHPFKEQKLVVVGDRQMAVFDDMQETDKLVLYPHSIDWKDQIPVANKAAAKVVPIASGEPLRAECAHFLECVETRRRPRTDGQEGLRVLEVLDRCQRSLATPAAPTANTPYTVHESAFIDEDVAIGKGTKIWHVSHIMSGSKIGTDCNIGQNVVIGPNVTVGNGVKVQNNVSVYEGITLEDHVFCGPSIVFTNVRTPRSEVPRHREFDNTLVRRGATLGANATIVCGVTIGQYAFVGAGAVVTKDVPDFALVVGNPAHVVGWSCSCGERLSFDGALMCVCAKCGLQFEKTGELVTQVSTSTTPT